jgi:putative ABC transport system substrate-binding protein
MKNILLRLLVLLCVSSSCFAATEAKIKKVLISQVIEHPALDATTRGIIDGLAQKGYKRDENLDIRIESAQGNAGLAAQIANKFAMQTPDVVVGVGTLAAQSFGKYTTQDKVKLVFASVTDPSKISTKNTTGMSNFVKLEPQLQLFKKLQPNLKRLGVLYNSGEGNSVSIVRQLEAICPQFDIILVKQSVPKAAEVPQAAKKLAADCDAIFISNDNTMLSAMQSIVKAAHAKHIPLYVSDTAAVPNGAVAALGPDQYSIGVETGMMIAKILDGQDIATIPIKFPSKTDICINSVAAKLANIKVNKS